MSEILQYQKVYYPVVLSTDLITDLIVVGPDKFGNIVEETVYLQGTAPVVLQTIVLPCED